MKMLSPMRAGRAGAGRRHAAGRRADAGPERRRLDRPVRRAAADGASQGWRCAEEALRHALADAEKCFRGAAPPRHREEKWQTPCASMMLAAAHDAEGLEFLWFGIALRWSLKSGVHSQSIGETIESAPRKRSARARSRREKNLPAAGRAPAGNSSASCAPPAIASIAAVIGCSVPMRAPPPMSRAGCVKVAPGALLLLASRWLSGAGERLWRL